MLYMELSMDTTCIGVMRLQISVKGDDEDNTRADNPIPHIHSTPNHGIHVLRHWYHTTEKIVNHAWSRSNESAKPRTAFDFRSLRRNECRPRKETTTMLRPERIYGNGTTTKDLNIM
ncbi:hypothetical protein TNCV_1188181 [Trichonephila clavipes]|nr:hypothetical protein TNCV_1188181 [Trichonephila clavipes]